MSTLSDFVLTGFDRTGSVPPVERIWDAPRVKPLDFKMVFADEDLEKSHSGLWQGALAAYRERKLDQVLLVWRLEEAVCFPPFHLIATQDGSVFGPALRKAPLLRSIPQLEDPHVDLGEFIKGKRKPEPHIVRIRRSEQEVIVLGVGQWDNYYHWLIEFVSKIPMIRDKLAAGKRLVVPPMIKKRFRRESLSYFGIAPEQMIQIKKPTRFASVEFYGNVARSNTRLMQIIRSNLASGSEDAGSERIYISRADAGIRRVLNEDELRPTLEHLGFRTILASELSFADQKRTLERAAVVVSPHGAGLANVIFSRPGTKVIEIIPSGFPPNITSYAALCELGGLDYCALLARSDAESANSNMHVPLDAMRRALEHAEVR